MAGFTIDIMGRIKNFDIPRNQPLVSIGIRINNKENKLTKNYK